MGRQEAAAQSTDDLLVQQAPPGREGQPDEIVSGVAFLLSKDASFVNRIDVAVDGGVTAAIRAQSVESWIMEIIREAGLA